MAYEGSLRDLMQRAERGNREAAAALAEQLEPALRHILRRAIRQSQPAGPLAQRLRKQLGSLGPLAPGASLGHAGLTAAARMLARTASCRLIAGSPAARGSRDTIRDHG